MVVTRDAAYVAAVAMNAATPLAIACVFAYTQGDRVGTAMRERAIDWGVKATIGGAVYGAIAGALGGGGPRGIVGAAVLAASLAGSLVAFGGAIHAWDELRAAR